MEKNKENNSIIAISFCIPAYNQSKLVERCINSIVKYKGEDIEIIVTDDNSTEDILGVINSFGDSRIHYYRNDKNLGHDRNILVALSHASGRYAFLLRTRDYIISDRIPRLISVAKNSDASYMTGSALNQFGDIRLLYEDKLVRCGEKALAAHFALFIHPSGNIYKVRDLELEQLWHFLDKNNVPKFGFIVHNLIRVWLATRNDFQIISIPIWVYTDTLAENDKAVNRISTRTNVYDPSISISRYKYERQWLEEILTGRQLFQCTLNLISLYLDMITWNWLLSNSDKRAQYHYSFDKKRLSISKIRKDFYSVCSCSFSEKMGIEKPQYEKEIKRIFIKNRTIGAIRYCVMKATNGTKAYNYLSLIYKKTIKRV